MNFRKKGRDIPFDNIDSNLMMEYEQYLKSNDICPNSTSYYMRNLRAMYNRAVEKNWLYSDIRLNMYIRA